ncbi:hypothetical protein Q6670_004020 [Salmonella enterica]|nr:hypothetical protein [Salmonella enterica]
MKKTILTALALSCLATLPAHAISAKYRAQLERSGCTMESVNHGCDIHKTKAQNAKSTKADYSKYAGKYDVVTRDGKKLYEVVITATSVKFDGHLAEEPSIHDAALYFHAGAMTFTVLNKNGGNWANTQETGWLEPSK